MAIHKGLSYMRLLGNQWKSAAEIREIQDLKLQRLVRHAYTQVPYYRRLFDSAGLTPQDIRGVDDLPKIPTTSRDRLRSLPREEILAQNVDLNLCQTTRTSGSTGVPLWIFHRREDLSLTNLGWIRTYLARGFRPWHRMAEFRGARYPTKDKAWYEFFGFMSRKILASSDDPQMWLSELQGWHPQALVGRASTLRLLAMTIQDQGVTDIRPEIVFATSELLDGATRGLLASVFQSQVIDVYGSEEGRCIAWECDRCPGYHINADLVIVEFLQGGQPVTQGSDGEIVITNLHSFAMPFIRFEQADVGILASGQPICGRGLPLMKMIKGRCDDFVVLRQGRKIPPQVFSYAVAPVGGVREWRVIQESMGQFRIEVVAAPGPKQSRRNLKIRRRIKQALEDVVGQDAEITVEIVDAIPRATEDKFRSVLSLVDKGQ